MQQPDPGPDWIAALRAAVQRMGSIQAAADTIGYSRTAVSLVLAGKYDRDTSRLAEAVRTRLGQIECPFLAEPISGQACADHQQRPEPGPDDPEYWHWRACAACRVGLGKKGKAA